MKKNFLFMLLLTPIIFFSCKKEIHKDGAITSGSSTVSSVDPYPLDWQNLDFIPSPENVRLPMPWKAGSLSLIDADIAADNLKSDGWELVYNLFANFLSPNNNYFMLYNKYRGVLKIYYYLPASTSVPSNYLTHSLVLGGTNGVSSMLNFSGNDIIDITKNILYVTQAQPYQVAASGAWYAAQFEFAYDPSVKTKSYYELNLQWLINSISVTSVVLNGKQSGSLTGTVQQASKPADILSKVGTAAGQGLAAAIGLKGLDGLKAKGLLTDKAITSIKKGVEEALTGGVKSLITGVFSAVIGGSSSSKQMVDLKINTSIQLEGSMQNNSLLLPATFAIPGTQNIQTQATYAPGFSSSLGVFNLTSIPVVNVAYTTLSSKGVYPPIRPDRGIIGYDYWADINIGLDANSMKLLFNPDVLEKADIRNVTYEVLYVDPTLVYQPYVVGLESEIVGSIPVYKGVQTLRNVYLPLVGEIGKNMRYREEDYKGLQFAVRVSFDVVPKNGAPAPRIIKTFRAQSNYINHPSRK